MGITLNKLSILGASIAAAVVSMASYIAGVNAVFPIMTGMIIATLFSILNEIGLLRKIAERVEKVTYGYTIEGFENVVNEVTYIIRKVQNDVGKYIYIRRALPLELASIDEKVTAEYVKVLTDIISGGEAVNYYCDESIYGYHHKKEYRRKTYNFIKKIYLEKNNNTSILYVTKLLRNIGLILVGRGTRLGSPEEFYWSIIISGDKLDKALVTKNEAIVNIVNEIWESFKNLCEEDSKDSIYIDFFKIESEKLQEVEGKIKNILELNGCLQ